MILASPSGRATLQLEKGWCRPQTEFQSCDFVLNDLAHVRKGPVDVDAWVCSAARSSAATRPSIRY
jgi:hypothetical protein